MLIIGGELFYENRQKIIYKSEVLINYFTNCHIKNICTKQNILPLFTYF